MNNHALRFRGVEVAASRSRRRSVRVMKVSAARRPAGGNAGCCVKAHRTELGIKCHAAAPELGAGLRPRSSTFFKSPRNLGGLGATKSRSCRGQAPTPSAVVSLGAFAYCRRSWQRVALKSVAAIVEVTTLDLTIGSNDRAARIFGEETGRSMMRIKWLRLAASPPPVVHPNR